MIYLLRVASFMVALCLLGIFMAVSAESNDIIPVNSTGTFAGNSKDYILSLRKKEVARYNHINIYPSDYRPSPAVFRQVSWGVDWARDIPLFINNPYLLVLTSAANRVNPLLPFCSVSSVTSKPGKIEVTYKGESARKWFYYINDYYDSHQGEVRLWFVNAYDAGYRYFHLDSSLSMNVDTSWPSQEDSVVRGVFSGREYFHVGHLKKNNISPAEPKARFRLQQRDRPTILYIKLWKERPSTKEDRADLAYVIILEP